MDAIKSYVCCLFLLRIVSYTSLPYAYHGGWLIRDGNCLRYACTRDHYRLLMVSVLLIFFFFLCCVVCLRFASCVPNVAMQCLLDVHFWIFCLTFIYHYEIFCSPIVRCFSLCLGYCFLSCIFS
jgi:hypothetical protein